MVQRCAWAARRIFAQQSRAPVGQGFQRIAPGAGRAQGAGRHIFDHLESMVETDCWIGADRKVYARSRRWCSGGWQVSGFYVHPRTGLLCFVQRPSARQRKKQSLLRQEIDEVQIDCARSFKLIDGQWYFVNHEVIDMGRYEPKRTMWDVVQRRQVQLSWGRNRVAVNNRQCNREEVRKICARIAEWKQQVRRM
jgi:hypothetical protein